MHPSLNHLDHRPWSLPRGPWLWRQSWCDLLFAHWPIPVETARRLVPAELEIDTFAGQTYVGVVPFRMADVAPRAAPAVPGLSFFPELNVRLYVKHNGRPGVWFLSLDAGRRFAAWAGRTFFYVPYHYAQMRLHTAGPTVRFTSHRPGGVGSAAAVQFKAVYRPDGDVYHAQAGTIDHWLTARYCLYAQTPAGELRRVDIHHARWPLQPAVADVQIGNLLDAFKIEAAERPSHLHFARRIDVINWGREKLRPDQ